MIGIYKIASPSKKVYIGKSKDIEKRFKGYKNISYCKQQRKLYNSLIKYGWEQHIFEIIEECSLEQLNEREIYWGGRFEVLDKEKGLNLRELGRCGGISEETKLKIGLANKGNTNRKGQKISEEHRHIISITNKGRKFDKETVLKRNQKLTGIKRSKESIEKGAAKRKGQKRNQTVKDNFSKQRKGILNVGSKHTQLTKDKISKANKNKPRSEETKRKISQTKLNNPQIMTEERKQKHRDGSSLKKPIIQFSLDGKQLNEFNSINEAFRQTGVGKDCISACVRGKQITSGGFKWKYKLTNK